MKRIKQIDFKYIEINFQYKNELITIKSEPFITLENAKIKAIKKMINIPKSDIHYFYLGLDITKNKDKKIGDLFYHCEKVNIKLKSKDKKINKCNISNIPNLSLSIDKNKNASYITNISKAKNSLENKKCKIKPLIIKNKEEIKTKPKLNVYDIFKNNFVSSNSRNLNKNNDFQILFGDKNHSVSNEQRILPQINKTSIINESKTDDNNYLCKCKKGKISNYCKNCKMLICNNCLNSEKHKNHLMIHLNEYNYIKDIIDYGNNIVNEIINNINIHKTLIDKLNIIPLNTLINEKEKIIQKFQMMIDKYYLIVNKIEKYLHNKQEEERFKLEILSNNKLLNKISNEIKDYMNNIKNENLNFNNFEVIMNDLSSKEVMLNYFNRNIFKFHLINEINIKIKSTIKSFEKIIDELKNKDNIFNLDKKYYDELINMKIIETPKIKKEIKDPRISIIIGGVERRKSTLNRRRKRIFSIIKPEEEEDN